jgi:hypothetical protein
VKTVLAILAAILLATPATAQAHKRYVNAQHPPCVAHCLLGGDAQLAFPWNRSLPLP